MYKYNHKTPAASYTTSINKMLLTSLSVDDHEVLGKLSILSPDAAGVFKVFYNSINQHSKSILRSCSGVWQNINHIKEILETREQINDENMSDTNELDALTACTEDIKKLIDEVSQQERDFLEIYDSVNQNIYNIYNQYRKSLQESITQVEKTVESITENYQLPLSDKLYNSNEVHQAQTVQKLQDICTSTRINNYFSYQPLIWALEQPNINTNNPQHFAALQAWTIVLARHAAAQSGQLNTNLDQINAKGILQSILESSHIKEYFHIKLENFAENHIQLKQLEESVLLNKSHTQSIEKTLQRLKK